MIYADNAATSGTIPTAVRRAVADYLRHPGNPGRGTHSAAMEAARLVLDTRMLLAEFFDCDAPERVVFASGATESLNLLLSGTLAPGCHVVTTRFEHNSVLRPLYRMNARLSVTDGSPEAIGAALTPETAAVIVTHASNVTGEILDVRAVGSVCRRHGVPLFVDAAQSAGLLPISMREDGIGALCFAGHKGFRGIQGIGGLLIQDESLCVHPLKVGGSGFASFEHHHPQTLPEALEAGTLNLPGIASLHAAVLETKRRGMDRLLQRERVAADAFLRAIEGIPGMRVYRNYSREHMGIVSMNVDGWDAAELADILATTYDICVRAGAHCAPLIHEYLGVPSTLRFSFGPDNTIAQAKVCAQAVREIVSMGDER